ncbi:MAG: AzlC family ABC transporter permease [Hyphomicrobiales bacterium]|nr:AzlC family ABC transporter permease [Hyphomicrobiales bacterium]
MSPPPTSAFGWFLAGQRQFVSLPAVILIAAFTGFGGLAHASGVGLAETVFLVAFVWALPSMIVVVGAIQAGAPLLATMFAVALSAARLMPMTMALIPILRAEKTPKWALYALSHFVAITAWVFGMTKLPDLPREGRAPYFAGFAVTLTVFNMGVAAAAWLAAAKLPPLAAAGLVLLMPLYFALSLWNAARTSPTERLALIFGMAIAPAMHALAPNLDLLLTGLVGGLAAHVIGSRLKSVEADLPPSTFGPADPAALVEVALVEEEGAR